MKRLLFLFSAQRHRHMTHYHRHYHPRVVPYVMVDRHYPYYEEKVVYIKEKQHSKPIVINNYIVRNNNENEHCERNYDGNEYVSLVSENNQVICNNRNDFDYDDMWSQTVWFKRGQYDKIRQDGKIALDNVFKFLNEHTDAKVVLYGYASRRYGTYEYNKSLAKNRLHTISNYLVNVYMIDWSRIKMCVIGTDSAEYSEDSWNQCVVIKCER